MQCLQHTSPPSVLGGGQRLSFKRARHQAKDTTTPKSFDSSSTQWVWRAHADMTRARVVAPGCCGRVCAFVLAQLSSAAPLPLAPLLLLALLLLLAPLPLPLEPLAAAASAPPSAAGLVKLSVLDALDTYLVPGAKPASAKRLPRSHAM